MQKSIFRPTAVLITGAVLLFSCTKNNLSSAALENEINNNLTSGKWKVASVSTDGVSKSATLANYLLSFNANKSVVASDGSNNVSGNWALGRCVENEDSTDLDDHHENHDSTGVHENDDDSTHIGANDHDSTHIGNNDHDSTHIGDNDDHSGNNQCGCDDDNHHDSDNANVGDFNCRMNFGQHIEFNHLNYNWQLVSQSASKIVMKRKRSNNQDFDYLTLEKK